MTPNYKCRGAARVTVLLAVTILTGCAAHTWAPGPGMTLADFEPAKARCSMIARHGGSGFIAVGSQNYVAGAALGHAIGESIRTQQDFNDCMAASGWRIADNQNTPEKKAIVAKVKMLLEETKVCIASVKTSQQYSPIFAHLLIASYWEANVCRTNLMAETSKIAPPVSSLFSSLNTENANVVMLLVQRQITWGDAAQRQKKNGDEANAKLRTVIL